MRVLAGDMGMAALQIHNPGWGGSSPRETTVPYFSSIVSQYSSFCDESSSPHSSCKDTAHHRGHLLPLTLCILTHYLRGQAGDL